MDSLLNTSVFGEFNEEINICSLLCGSEGTLAFTTEITLQLDPVATKIYRHGCHPLSNIGRLFK